jgi:regulator of RNase E activity RraA
MESSVVYLRVDRVASALCEAARNVSVSDVHEAMGVTPARRALMTPRMRPLNRGLRIAGPAITAYCGPGDNLMMHRALYLAERGDVLVVVCQSETSGAQWGDVAARYALQKGLAGVIVHGCIRDTDALEQLRFPVWATAISPIRPEKRAHGISDFELHVQPSRNPSLDTRQRWLHVFALSKRHCRARPGNPCSGEAAWMRGSSPRMTRRGLVTRTGDDYPAAMLPITAMDGGK